MVKPQKDVQLQFEFWIYKKYMDTRSCKMLCRDINFVTHRTNVANILVLYVTKLKSSIQNSLN